MKLSELSKEQIAGLIINTGVWFVITAESHVDTDDELEPAFSKITSNKELYLSNLEMLYNILGKDGKSIVNKLRKYTIESWLDYEDDYEDIHDEFFFKYNYLSDEEFERWYNEKEECENCEYRDNCEDYNIDDYYEVPDYPIEFDLAKLKMDDANLLN